MSLKNVIPNWDQYFINLAISVSIRSPDPKKQVGAVIVDERNRIVSTGYNGLASKFTGNVDWVDRVLIKQLVIHAEVNAILYAYRSLVNCKLYTTLSPCPECMKLIKASGINDIYFLEEYSKFNISNNIAKTYDITLQQIHLIK